MSIGQPNEALDASYLAQLIAPYQLMKPFGVKRSPISVDNTPKPILIHFGNFGDPIGSPAWCSRSLYLVKQLRIEDMTQVDFAILGYYLDCLRIEFPQ